MGCILQRQVLDNRPTINRKLLKEDKVDQIVLESFHGVFLYT